MDPVTIMAGAMVFRMLAPVVKEGWQKLTKEDEKKEKRRIDDKSLDQGNKLELQRQNHEQRLIEARNSHNLALEQWKQKTYYERCWPLRNPFEMQICEPISNDKAYFNEVIVPCRLISAMKDSDHPYAKTINGNLSSFIVNHYPTNSLHAVVSEIGAWKEDAPSNDASINYLYAGLKKQPVMVMMPTLINDGNTFIFKVWSWGLGEELNYPAGFEFGRIELKPLYLRAIYEESMAMIRLKNEMKYEPSKLYSPKLQHNISIIKEINENKLQGQLKLQMLSFLRDAPEIDQAVKCKMETTVSGIFCCIAGMYADAYHLLEYKTLPKLPSLLSNIPGLNYTLPCLKEYYYTLLENMERIEHDKSLLANLYLDVADSFSKLPFTFENQEEVVIPFIHRALGKYIQSKNSDYIKNKELSSEIDQMSSVKAIVKLDYKFDTFVQKANEILNRVNWETL